MKARVLWALAIGALWASGAGATARAQGRETEASPALHGVAGATRSASDGVSIVPDSSHSYDARALRFETNWGNVSIIRGADGSVVGTAGWFRDSGIESLLATSPSALKDFREYQTNNFRGSLVGVIGAATTVVGLLVATNSSNNASSPVMVIGGISAMVWGAQHLSRSYASLSRALWWYNRDLVR